MRRPPTGGKSTTAIARGRLEGNAIVGLTDIFVAQTNSSAGQHFGGRIAFDKDGYLYLSVGDRGAPPSGDLEAHPAQNPGNHQGTINRLHDDGRVPPTTRSWASRTSARRSGRTATAIRRGCVLRPGHGRPLGGRARTAWRRRAQHAAERKELRLAGDHVRHQLQRHADHRGALAPRHGAADQVLGAVHRHVSGLTHLPGRQVSGVEGQRLRGRPRRPAAGPRDRWTARRSRARRRCSRTWWGAFATCGRVPTASSTWPSTRTAARAPSCGWSRRASSHRQSPRRRAAALVAPARTTREGRPPGSGSRPCRVHQRQRRSAGPTQGSWCCPLASRPSWREKLMRDRDQCAEDAGEGRVAHGRHDRLHSAGRVRDRDRDEQRVDAEQRQHRGRQGQAEQAK